jgi:hypothetical protein
MPLSTILVHSACASSGYVFPLHNCFGSLICSSIIDYPSLSHSGWHTGNISKLPCWVSVQSIRASGNKPARVDFHRDHSVKVTE